MDREALVINARGDQVAAAASTGHRTDTNSVNPESELPPELCAEKHYHVAHYGQKGVDIRKFVSDHPGDPALKVCLHVYLPF